VKLKDDKTCYRHDHGNPIRTTCRFGYCTVLKCWICGLPWADWGPIACSHKKNENGKLRWFKYPDMGKKPHVAAKESTMRKQKRSKRSSKR
jgi:hypothetical protein